MSIKYNGSGDMSMITVDFVGDGVATSLSFDCSKAPFAFQFTGQFPSVEIMRRVIDGPEPISTTMSGSVITVTWADPLPPPDPGTATPRSKMEFWLLYG